jgi:hypothetical protein
MIGKEKFHLDVPAGKVVSKKNQRHLKHKSKAGQSFSLVLCACSPSNRGEHVDCHIESLPRLGIQSAYNVELVMSPRFRTAIQPAST